jgi:TPR repeat protein
MSLSCVRQLLKSALICFMICCCGVAAFSPHPVLADPLESSCTAPTAFADKAEEAKCKALARSGNLNVQFALCEMKGPLADLATWCRLLAANTDPDNAAYAASAQRVLADLYHEGRGGVSQDYDEAFKWCRMAAEGYQVKALPCMQEAYFKGQGTQNARRQSR